LLIQHNKQSSVYLPRVPIPRSCRALSKGLERLFCPNRGWGDFISGKK